MKVIINGKIEKYGRVETLISEVVADIGERIGLPEDTSFVIEGLEFKVLFNIDGEERYATVPRDVNGETVHEMLAVAVHLDDLGNVIQTEDNEEESFYDGYTLARSVGQDYEYEGTTSAYADAELTVIESLGENSSIDVMSVRYSLNIDPETEIVRQYKGDLLVAEYRYEPKDIVE